MFRPLLLAALAAAAPASAQIVTDRPDLTESTEAVSGVQLETGVLVDRVGDQTARTAPQALVRVGLAPGVEARLGLPDYVTVEDTDAFDGFTDPSVGAKVEVGAVAGWDVAAIAEVSIPLGDDRYSEPASPLGIAIVGREFGAVSVGSQAELRWDRALDRLEVGGTLVVGTALTDRLGAFAEVAATDVAVGTETVAQVGGTVLLSPDTQLDVFGGAGLTDAAPDVFGGVGFSTRF